jgi:AraC-like DNA-binding protein
LNEPKTRQFFPENFSNEIYYSNLEEFNYFAYRSNFSIKYVIEGKEAYILNGKRYSATTGQYLLVNNGRAVETTPECNSEAISIFLDMDLISEVYDGLQQKEEQLLDNFGPSGAPSDVAFFENAFSHNDSLGATLKKLHKQITSEKKKKHDFTSETYYSLAESLIASQQHVHRDIGNIQKARQETREELYKRVLIARDFLRDLSTETFDFDALSHACMLSKYHLIRSFKTVFGVTPYQYFITCKIQHAKKELSATQFSITEVAYRCGFNDIYSFSKTFRSVVGMTPSAYKSCLGKN